MCTPTYITQCGLVFPTSRVPGRFDKLNPSETTYAQNSPGFWVLEQKTSLLDQIFFQVPRVTLALCI